MVKKKKNIKFNCCGEEEDFVSKHDCDCKYKEPLKVKFCPNCKSTDVQFVFKLKNLFGLVPRIECNECKNSGIDFPLLVVKDKKNLSKKKKGGKNE